MEYTKKRPTQLSLEEKIKVLEEVDRNPHFKRIDIARKLNMQPSTLNSIISNKEAIAEAFEKCGSTKRKRVRASKFPILENNLYTWFTQARANGVTVDGKRIREQAMFLADKMGIYDFTASNGWIDRFKTRHGIVYKATRTHRCTADVNSYIRRSDCENSASSKNSGVSDIFESLITVKEEPPDEQQELHVYLTNLSLPAERIPGEEIPGIPIYTAKDVAAHDNPKSGIWVCYKSGVYNITDFIAKHPGGDKILMAAGGALEPFWELFAVHKSLQVLEILEEYRIGNLSLKDRGLTIENMEDPFASDPLRHPILMPSSIKPFNAEPPLELLVENFITPNELFFVRNHLPVPDVDPEMYELEVCGIGIEPIELKLDDLKMKFEKHTVTTTIQCAGNRRSELNKVKEVKGLNWGSAAISTAEWSGARLVDVLKYAGVNLNDPKIQHVQFEGLDTDPANMPYGASVPADKALDPKNDVLLAYEMNGQELPRDHGYPLRVIVPGVVGARNVKWLGRIIVSEEESKSHWQKNDYKGFSPSTTWENVNFNSAPAIQELPVNSAICKPSDGSTVHAENGTVKVAGYAWSGGGRKIVRVDVSSDGGKTWLVADLLQDRSPLYRSWAWTIWQVNVPVPQKASVPSDIEIICKAVDSSYNVQPDTFPAIWNLRGVLGNAWHRIRVTVGS